MTIILPITLTMAGAAGLINLWLAARVGQVRKNAKIELGDGGNESVLRRMRAHANFNEYTPMFLILLGLIELASEGNSPTALWLAGVVFIAGRLAHALGMDKAYPNKGRMIGTVTTLVVLLGLSLFAIYLPHAKAGTITEDRLAMDSEAMNQAERVSAE